MFLSVKSCGGGGGAAAAADIELIEQFRSRVDELDDRSFGASRSYDGRRLSACLGAPSPAPRSRRYWISCSFEIWSECKFSSRSNRLKYFWAWLLICAPVRVPTVSSTRFQSFPWSFSAMTLKI